ncbi:MAG: hypothetical protein WEA58_10845 [Balneolaceae bacterium]
MNSILISAHNLKLLLEDEKHFNKKVEIAEKRNELAFTEDDKMSCSKRLHAYNNIQQYKPLIEKTEIVIDKYPHFFKAKSNKGVVFAIQSDGLRLDNQGNQGFCTDYVPVKNIIAKSIFGIGSIANHCRVCKDKIYAKKISV